MSGCLWRNRKAMEGVSRAALGHLTCIWSFVADNQTGGVVTAGELKALGRGNPNASRWVKELVGVRFLEPHPEGYLVHDYGDWNRLPDNDANEGANRDANEGADKSADRDANKNADNPQSMITGRYAPVPRAHVSQDPRPKTQEREAREPDAGDVSVLVAQQLWPEFSSAYEAWCDEAGRTPSVLSRQQRIDAVTQARAVERQHGCDFATAVARLMAAAHELADRKHDGDVYLALRKAQVPKPAGELKQVAW